MRFHCEFSQKHRKKATFIFLYLVQGKEKQIIINEKRKVIHSVDSQSNFIAFTGFILETTILGTIKADKQTTKVPRLSNNQCQKLS